MKFSFNSRILFYDIKVLFFTEIDFCKPGVIQGFDLNFNLYLLVFLKGAKLSNNSLILFKNISVEQSTFCQELFEIEGSGQR